MQTAVCECYIKRQKERAIRVKYLKIEECLELSKTLQCYHRSP